MASRIKFLACGRSLVQNYFKSYSHLHFRHSSVTCCLITKPSVSVTSPPPSSSSDHQRKFSSWNLLGIGSQPHNDWEKRANLKGLGGLIVAGSLLVFYLFDRISAFRVEAKAIEGHDEISDEMTPRKKWNFIADIVEKASPAVVYIEVQGRHPFTKQKTAVANSSGFIVRSDGVILTNAHAVANQSTVNVRLQDGRNFTGIVQAVDPISDLATVKISASNLPTLKLGRSSDLRSGEWVVAMGSPLQLSNTVTVGIVSSTERSSKELGLHNKDFNYIQTDANINFGNSGGPLVNLDGEAIGINTMMVTTGIAFAIPSDYAARFLEKAKHVEKRTDSKAWFGTTSKTPPNRRYVGITMLSLTPDIVKSLKLHHHDFPDVGHGVLVHRVEIGSPAHKAGIQSGDVISKINDSEIKSSSDVYSTISSSKDLLVTVHRGLDTLLVNVVPESVE